MVLWLKKYWEIVTGAVLLFLGVFIGLWLKKTPVIVQGEDPEKKAIDEKVAVEEQQIQIDAAAKTEAITEEHSKEVQDVVSAETAKELALEKSPDDTNAFLKGVGRSVLGDDSKP